MLARNNLRAVWLRIGVVLALAALVIIPMLLN
ncbi:hypothetical protein FG93_05276 [Bosea sp. LC85]|nr:hypothetical protein FG93_05276 [Bosea sp. LC85]